MYTYIPQAPSSLGREDSKARFTLELPRVPLAALNSSLGWLSLNDTPFTGCLLFPVSLHLPNYLHIKPCLRLCFWGSPNEDTLLLSLAHRSKWQSICPAARNQTPGIILDFSLPLPPHGVIHLYRQMHSRISHLRKGPLDPKLPPATAPFLGLSSEPRLLKDLSTLAAFPSILCLPPT